MQIIEKSIKDIHPYENNPRINDSAVDAVAASIKEFGFKNPIIIDSAGVIVAGHTRYKAAKKLKLSKVPCIVADDLSEEQINAFRLADNKVGELATWDFDLLNIELDNIADIDMSDFGFDLDIDDEPQEVQEDDFDAEPPEEPTSKLGDIYQLGNHRLMCGDSTNAEHVAKLMNGEKADMVFTDPPYGVDYQGICNDDRQGLEKLLDSAFANIREVSNAGISVYCFHSDRCADIFNKVYRKYCHFSSMIIWVKKSLVLSQTDYQSQHEPCLYGWLNNGTHNWYGDRKQVSVWNYERESRKDHTTPKPVALAVMP